MRVKIFISYRRDDAYAAGRLYDRLSEHFSKDQIFMDVDALRFGNDFFEAIEEKVRDCEVLIAVIGVHWLSSENEHEEWRRVRIEIATALKRDILVIPVLVDDALKPQYTQLPYDLKGLAYQKALRVSDTSFDDDCRQLVDEIVRGLRQNAAMQQERMEKEWLDKRLAVLKRSRHYEKAAVGMHIESPVPNEIRRRMLDLLEVELGVPDALLGVLASAKFPKNAERRTAAAPAESERKPVDCTVFAPDRVERKQSALLLLQVFLHAPDERQQAEADAVKYDPETKERGHKSLVLDAPVGTIFAFVVEIEGFEFREGKETVLWTGRPHAATFPFDVPKGCKWGQHTGTVRILENGLPVGKISFQIEVVRDASNALKRPLGKEARHYHACFCSYSSLDRAEMLKRAQGLRATGLETFIDVMTLRPGDIWNPKIFAAIDESDLFVVIWSKNARDSKWVKKESRHALKLWKQRGSPDFVPIPVEGPPIPSVPRGLNARHFNDELLSLIRAAELETQERERKKTEQPKPEA